MGFAVYTAQQIRLPEFFMKFHQGLCAVAGFTLLIAGSMPALQVGCLFHGFFAGSCIVPRSL